MPISNTSQLGLIRLGLAQLGVVEPAAGAGNPAPSVYDASTLAESVSVSVVGAPWLLEASVVDTVATAEVVAWQIGTEFSVFDAATAAENVALTPSAAASSNLLLLGVG